MKRFTIFVAACSLFALFFWKPLPSKNQHLESGNSTALINAKSRKIVPPSKTADETKSLNAPTSPETSAAPLPAADGIKITSRPEIVSLRLDSRSIETLETAVQEIRRDVALHKVNRGWLVHFDNPNELMSSLGFADGDVIDQGLIESNFHGNSELKMRVLTLFEQLEE